MDCLVDLRGHCKDSSLTVWQSTQSSQLVVRVVDRLDVEGWVGSTKMWRLNNTYCFIVVFPLQFKQLQRVVTMALKSFYCVCVIKKLDLVFNSFSVRSQDHSYKNSIVFRLARHLCASTSLVLYWFSIVSPLKVSRSLSKNIYPVFNHSTLIILSRSFAHQKNINHWGSQVVLLFEGVP